MNFPLCAVALFQHVLHGQVLMAEGFECPRGGSYVPGAEGEGNHATERDPANCGVGFGAVS